MKRPPSFMLLGAVEAGKSTLFNMLFGKNERVRKTQAIEFESCGIDTPGEFFSHPRLYHALINTSSDVDTLVYVHACDSEECRLPPGLLSVYSGKRLVGVITKTDLPDCDAERAEQLLRSKGFSGPIFRISVRDPEGVEALRRYLFSDMTDVEE